MSGQGEAKGAGTNNSLDKPVEPVEPSGQATGDPPAKAGANPPVMKAPPAIVQDMINHRRQLKTMLAYTEKFLTKHGVRLN